MKIISYFLIFFLLISCEERKQNSTIQAPNIEITKKSRIILIDSAKIAAIKDTLLLTFYNANNNKTFWVGDSIRKKILPLLNNVAQEGLFPKNFDLKKINSFEKNIDSLSDISIVDYDILLTQNLSRYIQKVSKGSLDPKSLYDNYDLKENEIDFQELLLNFQKKDSFAISVKLVRPKHIVYKRLKEALNILNTFPEEKFTRIEIEDKVVLNDTNLVLLPVKKKLIYWKDLLPLDSLTAIFDIETELAIKKFQMRHGLASDGVIGKGTIKALNFSKKDRKEQIIANMERWRWYPRKFEKEYLIVNIPDYSLNAIKNQDTIRTCKTIVGKFKRQTPVLSSKLTHLVINPTWMIPPTILEKDIIPAALRDSSYFHKKSIAVFDTNNEVVNIIDWKVENADSYRYVQSPGRHNALGLIKFMFPNKYMIYLHDTNSRSSFGRNIRALSSGCVRVQKPLELAEYLLDNPKKWSLKKINETLKKDEPKAVYFKKDIYIHILYWTAWSEKGSLQFRGDLYDLDSELYQKLSN